MPGRRVNAIRAHQNPIAWLYRYILGRPLNGAARTNASFLHPATKNESGYFHVMSWHRCAQWKVAVVRWGILLWALIVLRSWWMDTYTHDYTGTYVAAALWFGIILIPYVVYWAPRIYDLRHYLTIVSPIAKAIGPTMGIDKTPASSYIDINRKFVYRVDGSHATIAIPHSLAGQPGTMRNIELAIRNCLATNEHELRIDWRFAGRKPYINMAWAPAPPKMVSFSMCQELLAELRPSQIFIGLGRGMIPVTVDLDNESPHLMISMGTGAGKSETAKGMATQLLHNDCLVGILDIKRISHAWAKSVDGVKYARDVEDIHEALCHYGVELERRNRAADHGHYVGKRLVIVIEEMNMLISQLESYWNEIREKTDPKISPAIKALRNLLFAGRQVLMHCILIGQYLTAKSVGGTEARENLGFRIMGRYSTQSWKNLAGDIPMPPPSRIPGRVQVVSEGIATEVQCIYFTDEEAIRWAYSTNLFSVNSGKQSANTATIDLPAKTESLPELTVEDLQNLFDRTNTETESDM